MEGYLMSKALADHARNSENRSSSSRNKDGRSTTVDRTQNIAALSSVSPTEAAFLSSLSAEEFNALVEERSEIARGV